MSPRLGFAGLGWIGAMRLEAIAEAGAAGAGEITALCEPAAARLEEVARAHPGAAAFSSFDEMLACAGDLGLDGVVIATPNALHAPQTLAALERGLAVFCQKPLALSGREAREMVDAARRADRLLGVDYSYRFTDGMQALRGMVERGELGRVFSVDAAFHNAYGPDKAWCRDPRLAGGGALMDLGVHLLDLALWVLDTPAAAAVAAVHGGAWSGGEPIDRPGGPGIDDFAGARIEVAGGAAVSLAVSWNAHAGQDCVIRLAAFGTAGGAEFRNVAGSFFDFELVRFTGRSGAVVVRESRDWLGRAIVDWAVSLGRGRGFDPEIERSVTVSRAIDAIYGRD